MLLESKGALPEIESGSVAPKATMLPLHQRAKKNNNIYYMSKKKSTGILLVLEKFNVLPVAIGLMVGASLKDVADNLIEDLLMPFLKPLIKKITLNGKKEKKDMYKLKIPGTGVELNLENIIESTIKFLGLSILIFLLMRFGIQVKKRPRRVRIMNWDKMPKRGSRSKSLTLH